VSLRILLSAALAAMLATNAPRANDVSIEVATQSDGSLILTHEVLVPAPPAAVWAAVVTAEGFASWAAPFAHVDFRIGGAIESSYRLDAALGDEGNIRNRIVAYLPERLLVLHAVAAPPGFPAPEVLPHLASVFEFEAAGEHATRLRVHGVGYRDEPAHAQVMALFRAGNQWSLQQLVKRFRDGPADWPALLGTATPAEEYR
jgi:uncharacterized protein YndB with AHSA1/START domain